MWWRKLYVFLKGKNSKLVWLHDFNGEIFLRIAWQSHSGQWYAYRFWSIKRVVFLNDDKTTSGVSYVTKWSNF